jgi:hypothetical protein
MAVYQITRIKHRRGTSGELPDALEGGEIGMTTDTGEIFFGASDHPSVAGRRSYPYQNIKILTELDVQRGIKGDVYHQGPLVNAICPRGDSSVISLFANQQQDYGILDFSLTSSDGNVKAIGTISFVVLHANLPGSSVTASVNASLNFGSTDWVKTAFSLSSLNAEGVVDGATWLRFNNIRTDVILLSLSGREWRVPQIIGFNS